MKKKLLFIIFLFPIFLFALSNKLLYIKYKDEIGFTDEEIAWIEKNPSIKVAVMSYWPKDENGGDIHYDLIDLINQYGKINLIPVTFKLWDNAYNQAKKGDTIKGMMNLGWSKKRESEDFFFSKPYDYNPLYIITKPTKESIKNFDSLEGKTVILSKTSTANEFLIDSFFNINIKKEEDEQKLYEAFYNDIEADAIATSLMDYKLINQYNLKVVDTLYEKYAEKSIAISKNEPYLNSIINKIIATIPANEFDTLKQKNKLTFTKEEENWLNQNKIMKYVYDPFYKPVDFKNEISEYQGIIKDIFDLLVQRSNIHLETIESISREDSFELVKNGRASFFSATVESDQLKSDYKFSQSVLLSIPYVFVSQNSLDVTNGFKSLTDKKVGILKDHQLVPLLKQIDSTLTPITFTKIDEAINALTSSNVDVLILDATTAKYHLDILNDESYEITYKTIFNQDLRIMYNKDVEPEFISIMDKLLKHTPKQDINDIVHKWTQVKIDTGTDWVFIGKITGGILVILIVVFINNRQLKSLVAKRTKDLHHQTLELENILGMFDKNVLVTKTDLDGVITYASEAYCKLTGYKEDELVGKSHNIVRDPETPKELFALIWKSLKREIPIRKELRSKKKNGDFFWTDTKFSPDYDSSGKLIGYSAIKHDITSKKEVEELKDNLEIKVEERTKDLNATKKEVEKILASILLPVLITDKDSRQVVYANKFAQTQYDKDLKELIGTPIDELYTTKDEGESFEQEMQQKGFVENLEQSITTHTGKEFTALLSVIPITYKNHESYIGMTADITKQKKIEEEIREMHKHTRDSIEYASLIQHALIPDNNHFAHFFSDYFANWTPKDIVGGDIYLFEQVDSDSCLLYVIDCTGHGVPGAFVTMLVKAVERQLASIIQNNSFIEVSPAWILSYFNKTIKMLLKQETEDSISNAGFDGGVLYYNKKDKIVKFAGAETPLFYLDTQGNLKTVKGSRHSVGYKKSDPNFEFKEHVIEVEEGMKFYLTTDGYLDQNGGDKDFPFGKKRFGKIIERVNHMKFKDQEKEFIDEILEYQGDQDRNDDVTVVGLKI